MNDFSVTDILKEVLGDILLDRSLEKGVADAMELLTRGFQAEVGVVWLLDQARERLVPVFSISPVDLSNTSVELGINAESFVAKTGEPLMKNVMDEDERYNGTILGDLGLKVRNMLCVPLGNKQGTLGCI